jgi:hypothetical protein
MKSIERGTSLYRGGACKSGMAFFTTEPKVAKMYGLQLCHFKTKRKLKLFKVTHTSLKNVFKYLSPNTRLLLKFIFGTETTSKIQKDILKKLTGESSSSTVKGLGQRLSLTEIDAIVFRALSRELRGNYDGIYVPPRFTKFHGGLFHSEIFISKRNLLDKVSSQKITKMYIKTAPSSSLFSKRIPMSELFIKYTKNTRTLLRPHPSVFVVFLGGGMAVKLYLRARGIPAAKTSDFDFKFAVSKPLRTQTSIKKHAELMRRIVHRHVKGFVKFLNRNGIPSTFEERELKGVPLDKPGGNPNYKKVYKVYNYTIHTRGRSYELVDTSLVMVPGITRKQHLSLKWSRKFGFPIQNLTHLWRDTLYVLAGSFVHEKTLLRNPINGEKKEKGIKNAIRAGHLSYLTSKRRGTAYLVHLARKLIEDIAIRDKKAGVKNSKLILEQLKLSDIASRAKTI